MWPWRLWIPASACRKQLQIAVHANKGSGVSYPFPVSRLEVDLEEWAEGMVQRLIQLMKSRDG